MNLWIRCTRYFLLNTSEQLDDFYEIMMKIIDNIINNPDDKKFQELKLSNGVIKKRVVERNGGIEFMQAIGFNIVTNDEGNKIFKFSEEYPTELLSGLNWLRETIETCKHTREDIQVDEICCTTFIQIRFTNGTTVMGGFFPQEQFQEVLNFTKSFFSEERQHLVTLHLPHLATVSSTILTNDQTLEELGLSPRATLVVTLLNDDERIESFQQSRNVVIEEVHTRVESDKLARQRKLAEQEARKKQKEDALLAFQEDREKQKQQTRR